MTAGGGKSDTRAPVAIVGAGIIGVSAAIHLQREGYDIILIDRAGPSEGASFGNGGVLASCSVVPVTVPGLVSKAPRMLLDPSQPLFLRWSYLPRLMPWLVRYLRHCTAGASRHIAKALATLVRDSLADHQALAKGTGAERWVKPADYLFLYRNRAHFDGDAFGWSLRREMGFEWDELEGEAFHAYDRAFAKDLDFAVCLKGHGFIADPGRYVKELAAHVERHGGRILRANVTDFVRENGRIAGVAAGNERIACSAVIIAAGAWSKPLARKLGLDIPLESERGYHLELWEPSITPRAPMMIASGKFVATPMDGRLRLAGIVEFGGLDAPPSAAPIALLRENIKAAIPGITWKSEQTWMGHRPAPADSIPVIGAAEGVEGAFLGFGHHHIGLTAGPKTGRLLAQLVSGKVPEIDCAPYAPGRFH